MEGQYTDDWREKAPVENHVGVKFCDSIIVTDGSGIEDGPLLLYTGG